MLAVAAGPAGAQIAPPNDSCIAATVVSGSAFVDEIATDGATAAPDDPTPPCGDGITDNSVWYRFTLADAGTVTLSTIGSDYDTILAVYEGVCGELSPVHGACNDDDPRDGAQSTVSFVATAGTTYTAMVSAYGADGGHLIFDLRFRYAPHCVGDCNGDGLLTGSECAQCSQILAGSPLTLCPPCDDDGDSLVSTREVNQCLLGTGGCIACEGDCNGDGRATAGDLVTAVAILLHCPCDGGAGGSSTGCPALPTRVSSCLSVDRNFDGCISSAELELLKASIFTCSR